MWVVSHIDLWGIIHNLYKMRRKDTPIERINSKINSLPYEVLFLGYVDGWKTFETTKIKLKDVEFNSEEEIMYSSFVRSGWKCKLRRLNDIKLKRLPLVKSNIEKKIKEIKQKEQINLEFIDFVEDHLPNDVIADEVRIILRDLDYNETGDINYSQFMQKTYSRFIDQVNRDNYLVQYCKDNNIRLLRISYKDNNRLEEVIKAFLVDGIDISTKVEPKLLPVPITYYKSNYGR